MMFLGTNDIWSGTVNTTTILAAYTTLVGQMRAQNPSRTVMVAQITPMDPSGCSYCTQGVINLNAAIPAWAAGITTSQSPVSVVNCWAGYNDTADTIDGVHPNDAGDTILANDWFAPLSSAVVRVGGQAPVTSSAGATSTVVVSPVWGQCGKWYPVFLHLGLNLQCLD
jgi:lysophospholipase L1-like esterase